MKLQKITIYKKEVAIFISKFIEFTPEQKERAASVDLEEFLLRQGEKFIKSGREKRLASDHSITVRGLSLIHIYSRARTYCAYF